MEKTDLPEPSIKRYHSFDPSVFIAPQTTVVGEVAIGKESSIWYGSVLRGDINSIRIGERSNIQDLTLIHLENDIPCSIGNDVTVGHRAILHACTIEDGALIGMGAIILNGAVIKRGAVIGAGAVVKEHTVVEANTLWAGIPAVKKKTFTHDSYEHNKKWAAKYVELAKRHAEEYR
ncbi:gamma carbonic anhydrase family protein [Candidatus Marinamargulisbacteria bacterium SCGC AG-343-D04]|nr:gamma carbonic anhydrase family protein [Candidatus Marinamargulisbacteria bacterium SCGC AG-343-D04]